MPVSAVVPTYGRPDDVRRCVRSLGAQTRPPAEVVLVDDGDLDDGVLADLDDALPRATSFDVTASDGPAGSSVARNTGARAATGDIVLFLDDDVELGPEYLARLVEVYERYDDGNLGAVGGFDANGYIGTPTHQWCFDLFGLGKPWRINRAGLSRLCWTDDLRADLPVRTDWLLGNNMSVKRELALEHPFPQWSSGREPHEDLAVGWSLANDGYHSVLDPKLPVTHHHSPDEMGDFGVWWKAGGNRVRLFREYGDPDDRLLLARAILGETIQQLFVRSTPRHERAKRAIGVGSGALAAWLADTEDPTF